MIQEQMDKNGTELEHYIDTIRRTVNEKLADLGYKYCEESVNYLLTGESIVEKNSEARLLEDVKYLLMKVRMLEDMMLELMIEKENAELNRKYPQVDIFGKKVKVKV